MHVPELFEGVANLVSPALPRQTLDLAQRESRKVDGIGEWSLSKSAMAWDVLGRSCHRIVLLAPSEAQRRATLHNDQFYAIAAHDARPVASVRAGKSVSLDHALAQLGPSPQPDE
jgi:hypothetical protein